MARIALLDPDRGSLVTIEVLLGRLHEIEAVDGVEACAGHDMVIYDLDSAGPQWLGPLEGLGIPVLVVAQAASPVPQALHEGPALALLRKPYDPVELRVVVKRVLARSARVASPARHQAGGGPLMEPAGWLDFPFVSQSQARLLERAAIMVAPIWLIGEQGSGRRRMAAEFVRRLPSPPELLLWRGQATLDLLFERVLHGEAQKLALLVHDIEGLDLEEQASLLSLIETSPGLRLLAISAQDPAEAVTDGHFSSGLYQRLSALSLRLAPLRERKLAIPSMAEALLVRSARGLGVGGLSFTSAATELLQAYMWPGNLAELETVLVRSLVGLNALGSGAVLDSSDIRFTDDEGSLLGRAEAGTERNRLVAPIRAETGEASFAGLAASLGHELRNDLTSISTAVQLLVAHAGEDRGLASLLESALVACASIEQMTALLEMPGRRDPRQLKAVDVDLARLLAESAAGLGLAENVSIEAPLGCRAYLDRADAVFIVNCLLAAAAAESRGRQVEVVCERPAVVVITVTEPSGGASGLRRLGEAAIPWQAELARIVAGANQASVAVRFEEATMSLRFESPVASNQENEEEEDGKAQSSRS